MKTRALAMLFFALLYGAATIFLALSGHGRVDQIFVGVLVTGAFTLFYFVLKAQSWEAARSASVQPAEVEIKAEKPRESIVKACPPHNWNVLAAGGHQCKACNYKAGT